jgi:hypothetical protein
LAGSSASKPVKRPTTTGNAASLYRTKQKMQPVVASGVKRKAPSKAAEKGLTQEEVHEKAAAILPEKIPRCLQQQDRIPYVHPQAGYSRWPDTARNLPEMAGGEIKKGCDKAVIVAKVPKTDRPRIAPAKSEHRVRRASGRRVSLHLLL